MHSLKLKVGISEYMLYSKEENTREHK